MSAAKQYVTYALPGLSNHCIDFEWDQWKYTDYFYDKVPPEAEVIERISGFACRALAIAMGEFACARLADASNAALAEQYFNAAWITMIRRRSCEYASLDHDDWPGVGNGPLRAAMLIVNDTLFEAEEDFGFALRGCWSINLARHICPDVVRSSFEEWLERSLVRLVRYHQVKSTVPQDIFQLNFEFGSPVAAELFDLRQSYSPEAAETQILDFESTIQAENRYYLPA